MKKLLGSVLVLLMIGLIGTAAAQLIEERLNETGQAIDDLRARNAQLLSPENFGDAVENYERASKEFRSGASSANVDKYLQRANDAVRQAAYVLDIAEKMFLKMLEARQACQEVEASTYAPEQYARAQKKLEDAVAYLEKGKNEAAEERAVESEGLFRDAELLAIKENIIGKPERAISEALDNDADEYAPVTLQKAKDLAMQAESILNKDRYAANDAMQKAEESMYQSRMALYITSRAKNLEKSASGYETLYLDIQGYLTRVVRELNLDPQYDNGMGPPIIEMAQTIKSILETNREESLRMNEAIVEKNHMIDSLQTLSDSLGKELSQLQGNYNEELERQKKLEEARKRQQAKFDRIFSLFTQSEAVTMIETNDLIIRLKGLTFPPGKATLSPESYGLLSKVLSAIQEFPGCMIMVEGHTDSYGREAANQALSEERAASVRTYLLANDASLTAEMVKAVGYGEDRPVASNETAEGRAENRRIEIIIKNAKKDTF